MSPTFSLLDLLYFSFITFWQFLLIPLLGGGLILVAVRGRQKVEAAIVVLIILISPLLSLQIMSVMGVLPPPLPRVSTQTFAAIYNSGLPFWVFVAAIAIGTIILQTPQSKNKVKILRIIARIIGLVSIGILLIDLGMIFVGHLTQRLDANMVTAEQALNLPPNPQYYLPGRTIKDMTQIGSPFFEGSKLLIHYKDKYGQIVYLTETPNAINTNGIECVAPYIEEGYCANIGKSPDGKVITGHPLDEYIGPVKYGYWSSGYSEVRGAIGTTLIEIGESTNLHPMHDDFVSYFASFKRVGKAQIPL